MAARLKVESRDVPYWQMHGLSFVLETRYFGEKGGAPRVLLTSIDEFIRLREEGEDARALLAARKNFQGWSPYRGQATRQAPAVDLRSRHWRKHWYYGR